MLRHRGGAACRLRALLVLALVLAALAAPAIVAAQPGGPVPGGSATVGNTGGDGVVLREGPGYDARVLTGFPDGTPVDVSDGPIHAEDGSVWFEVTAGGQFGYMDGAYLIAGPATGVAADPGGAGMAGRQGETTTSVSPGGTAINADGPTVTAADPGAAPAPPAPGMAEAAQQTAPPADLAAAAAAAPVGSAATAAALLDLRAGPGEEYAVLRVLPPGSALTVTGQAQGAWTPVWYNGTNGFAPSDLLAGDAINAAPPAAEPTATVPDATVAPDATPAPESAASETGAAPEAAAGGSGLVWPVNGGSWRILQGYNGSSHVNRDAQWQYHYALDIVRDDGDTAGVPVTSPASGTVRWTDPSSGGVSIDLGDGHAVALFHVTLDPSLRDGAPIGQGDPIGTISGPGGMGYSGTPHLHMALWETNDGGNWDRRAAPFTGAYAIEGQAFPDIGGTQQHRGVGFRP